MNVLLRTHAIVITLHCLGRWYISGFEVHIKHQLPV